MAKTQQTVLKAVGREVVITNPGKVFFPKAGHTCAPGSRSWQDVRHPRESPAPSSANEARRPTDCQKKIVAAGRGLRSRRGGRDLSVGHVQTYLYAEVGD